MSHAATNWAFSQRGLKPATKLVLLCLADRHNPDNGCFPSQERLCDDAEMSRSTLNLHLAELERLGLLIRKQRRNEQTRKQKSTVYFFAFEKAFEALKAEAEPGKIPCPKSGHGNADPVSEKQPKPCPENGQSRVRNPDTNPVREPVISNPRERVSDDDREGKEGEAPEAGEAADDADTVTAATWLRRFKAAHAAWPTYVTDSEPRAREAWFALDPDERTEAAERAADYVRTAKENGRKLVCAFGVYLTQKPWEKMPKRAPASTDASQASHGAPFGKAWSAKRLRILSGPMTDRIPAPTAFIASLIKQGGEAGERHRREHLARYGWPAVNHMHERAAMRSGCSVQPGDLSAGADFKPVKVGSALWDAWQAEHEARGWPWMEAPGRVEWVYFPASETDDLSGVRKALAEFMAVTETQELEAAR